MSSFLHCNPEILITGSSQTARSARTARSIVLLLAVAALSFSLAVVATIADGWPLPRAFDEFSYILAGDTFSRGRLTNPPHPLPDVFETIHVLQRPTYSSKYLPGHGLFLASESR